MRAPLQGFASLEYCADGSVHLLEPILTERIDGLPIRLALYRVPRPRDVPTRSAVLLLHGASAWSRTFVTPRGRGLAQYLAKRGHDVFLLDWRGSRQVTQAFADDTPSFEASTLDHAAEHDLVAALAKVEGVLREEATAAGLRRDEAKIDVFAQCLGGGMTAMAVGGGHLQGKGVGRVVLSTLGLFYDVPWDGVLKGDDHLLERVRALDPAQRSIVPDPDVPFPEAIGEAFAAWPRQLLPADAPGYFQRLTFLYGQTYLPENLTPGLHDDAALREQFGAMHLRLYLHGTQNVRRGFAAPFDAPEEAFAQLLPRRQAVFAQVPGGTTELPTASVPTDSKARDAYLDLAPWRELERVTLLTGEQNGLWHRSAIDRMHDFLRRALPASRCRKHVLPGYGHQDLLWGMHAERDVFPLVAAALDRDIP